jgi:hypothetical protein
MLPKSWASFQYKVPALKEFNYVQKLQSKDLRKTICAFLGNASGCLHFKLLVHPQQ